MFVLVDRKYLVLKQERTDITIDILQIIIWIIMQEKVFRRMDAFYDVLYQWSILKKIQVRKCWKHS